MDKIPDQILLNFKAKGGKSKKDTAYYDELYFIRDYMF
jgi:hypothetical protein